MKNSCQFLFNQDNDMSCFSSDGFNRIMLMHNYSNSEIKLSVRLVASEKDAIMWLTLNTFRNKIIVWCRIFREIVVRMQKQVDQWIKV